MSKLIVNSYEEFASHLGRQLGVSEWLQVDQERINNFADATLAPRPRALTRAPLPTAT